MAEEKTQKTSWGSVAGWYDELLAGDDTYQTQVILPNLMRLVDPQDGMHVIDIACGQGFFSHAFAKAGATVTGADISSNLIERAKQQGGERETFMVREAANLHDIADAAFDVATIVLALQNIKELSKACEEASRVLETGGHLVLVLNHPCFRIPKGSSWGYDEKTKTQYRRIDRYGTSGTIAIDMTPGTKNEREKKYTVSFHRPLQEYVKALAKAGLVVVGLEEWISHRTSEKGPRQKAEDRARKEFPLFLTIVAQKL